MRAGFGFCLLIVASACGAAPSGPATPSPNNSTRAVSITGTVLGPSGRPTGGVRVEVVRGPSAGQFSVTDTEGRYRLESTTANGTVQVRWSRDGYLTSDSAVVTVDGSSVVVNGALQRGIWTVSGVVTDRSGAPVSNARVDLLLNDNAERWAAYTVTDNTGRYWMAVSQGAGNGSVYAQAVGNFTRQIRSFTCQPPVSDPDAALCGDRTTIGVDLAMSKIVSVTLAEMPALSVGQTAPIRREVRLDDGQVIIDDGGGSAIFSNNKTSAFDPAVAAVQGGLGGLKVVGNASGTATLTTQIGSFRIQVPIRVLG
jgi:5-hydroxyisourate hydrolase-like protein (transthyretin family)